GRQDARMPDHGRLHERVAGAAGHAVPAGDAARLADRRAAVPEHAWMRILPPDAQRLVHLHVLTRLDATTAEDALARVVAIERIRMVDRIGHRPNRNPLVLRSDP